MCLSLDAVSLSGAEPYMHYINPFGVRMISHVIYIFGWCLLQNVLFLLIPNCSFVAFLFIEGCGVFGEHSILLCIFTILHAIRLHHEITADMLLQQVSWLVLALKDNTCFTFEWVKALPYVHVQGCLCSWDFGPQHIFRWCVVYNTTCNILFLHKILYAQPCAHHWVL